MKILSIIALVLMLLTPQLAYAGIALNGSDNPASPESLIMAREKGEPIDFEEFPIPDTL